MCLFPGQRGPVKVSVKPLLNEEASGTLCNARKLAVLGLSDTGI